MMAPLRSRQSVSAFDTREGTVDGSLLAHRGGRGFSTGGSSGRIPSQCGRSRARRARALGQHASGAAFAHLAHVAPACTGGTDGAEAQQSGFSVATSAMRCKSPEDLHDVLAALILSECVYKKVEKAGPEAVRAKVAEYAALFPPGWVRLEAVQMTLADIPQHYLIATTPTSLCVAFMGTKRWEDLLADANLLHTPVWAESARLAADQQSSIPAAHRGFLDRARAIHVEQLYELAVSRGLRLVLCGHSLGGAVAKLCTLRLLRELPDWPRPRVRCIAFATPAVGNAALAETVANAGWAGHFASYYLPEDQLVRLISFSQARTPNSNDSSNNSSSSSSSVGSSSRSTTAASASTSTSTVSAVAAAVGGDAGLAGLRRCSSASAAVAALTAAGGAAGANVSVADEQVPPPQQQRLAPAVSIAALPSLSRVGSASSVASVASTASAVGSTMGSSTCSLLAGGSLCDTCSDGPDGSAHDSAAGTAPARPSFSLSRSGSLNGPLSPPPSKLPALYVSTRALEHDVAAATASSSPTAAASTASSGITLGGGGGSGGGAGASGTSRVLTLTESIDEDQAGVAMEEILAPGLDAMEAAAAPGGVAAARRGARTDLAAAQREALYGRAGGSWGLRLALERKRAVRRVRQLAVRARIPLPKALLPVSRYHTFGEQWFVTEEGALSPEELEQRQRRERERETQQQGQEPPEGARGPFSFHRMLAYRQRHVDLIKRLSQQALAPAADGGTASAFLSPPQTGDGGRSRTEENGAAAAEAPAAAAQPVIRLLDSLVPRIDVHRALLHGILPTPDLCSALESQPQSLPQSPSHLVVGEHAAAATAAITGDLTAEQQGKGQARGQAHAGPLQHQLRWWPGGVRRSTTAAAVLASPAPASAPASPTAAQATLAHPAAAVEVAVPAAGAVAGSPPPMHTNLLSWMLGGVAAAGGAAAASRGRGRGSRSFAPGGPDEPVQLEVELEGHNLQYCRSVSVSLVRNAAPAAKSSSSGAGAATPGVGGPHTVAAAAGLWSPFAARPGTPPGTPAAASAAAPAETVTEVPCEVMQVLYAQPYSIAANPPPLHPVSLLSNTLHHLTGNLVRRYWRHGRGPMNGGGGGPGLQAMPGLADMGRGDGMPWPGSSGSSGEEDSGGEDRNGSVRGGGGGVDVPAEAAMPSRLLLRVTLPRAVASGLLDGALPGVHLSVNARSDFHAVTGVRVAVRRHRVAILGTSPYAASLVQAALAAPSALAAAGRDGHDVAAGSGVAALQWLPPPLAWALGAMRGGSGSGGGRGGAGTAAVGSGGLGVRQPFGSVPGKAGTAAAAPTVGAAAATASAVLGAAADVAAERTVAAALASILSDPLGLQRQRHQRQLLKQQPLAAGGGPRPPSLPSAVPVAEGLPAGAAARSERPATEAAAALASSSSSSSAQQQELRARRRPVRVGLHWRLRWGLRPSLAAAAIGAAAAAASGAAGSVAAVGAAALVASVLTTAAAPSTDGGTALFGSMAVSVVATAVATAAATTSALVGGEVPLAAAAAAAVAAAAAASITASSLLAVAPGGVLPMPMTTPGPAVAAPPRPLVPGLPAPLSAPHPKYTSAPRPAAASPSSITILAPPVPASAPVAVPAAAASITGSGVAAGPGPMPPPPRLPTAAPPPRPSPRPAAQATRWVLRFGAGPGVGTAGARPAGGGAQARGAGASGGLGGRPVGRGWALWWRPTAAVNPEEERPTPLAPAAAAAPVQPQQRMGWLPQRRTAQQLPVPAARQQAAALQPPSSPAPAASTPQVAMPTMRATSSQRSAPLAQLRSQLLGGLRRGSGRAVLPLPPVLAAEGLEFCNVMAEPLQPGSRAAAYAQRQARSSSRQAAATAGTGETSTGAAAQVTPAQQPQHFVWPPAHKSSAHSQWDQQQRADARPEMEPAAGAAVAFESSSAGHLAPVLLAVPAAAVATAPAPGQAPMVGVAPFVAVRRVADGLRRQMLQRGWWWRWLLGGVVGALLRPVALMHMLGRLPVWGLQALGRGRHGQDITPGSSAGSDAAAAAAAASVDTSASAQPLPRRPNDWEAVVVVGSCRDPLRVLRSGDMERLRLHANACPLVPVLLTCAATPAGKRMAALRLLAAACGVEVGAVRVLVVEEALLHQPAAAIPYADLGEVWQATGACGGAAELRQAVREAVASLTGTEVAAADGAGGVVMAARPTTAHMEACREAALLSLAGVGAGCSAGSPQLPPLFGPPDGGPRRVRHHPLLLGTAR